jgi:cellulose synthase/poly-beta-1,6-N-acetylglucosamine synthase-like glycosyltransferase
MSDSNISVFLFWVGVCGTFYAYLGFPAVVSFLAAMKRKKGESSVPDAGRGGPTQAVTIIIPAYNEENVIGTKIRNVLFSNYPRQYLDVIVVSDASSDRTDEIARSFEKDGVRLIVQRTRRGKTSGLNRAIELAQGEIVVFTDANAIYPADAILKMSRYFDNPNVGLVTGYTKYTMTEDGNVTEATNAYTTLERIVKRAESEWGCCVGADGAIFAMRKSLYCTLREDDINDFVIPLSVIDQGYQCLFAEDAYCSENSGKNLESEFRRQSRITNRTLRALWRNRHLLNPFCFPSYSFFLFSHKVIRFLVPVFIILSAGSLAFLAPRGGAYLVAGVAALLSIAMAALSNVAPSIASPRFPTGRPVRFFGIFLTVNLAVLHGWWKFISGRRDIMWQHDRSTGK